ncbi:MAG: hypothetical protein OXK80_05835 [Bdellovibrionales bacterium]|nr:hypothetical protein [Bdellovibrionales bacterium]
MKWFTLPFLFVCIHTVSAKKIKADTVVKKQKPVANINQRRINQLSDSKLNQAVDSVFKSFDELALLCQNENPLNQRVEEFQQKLIAIKAQVRQIKEDFLISDPSIHSYINTLNVYLNSEEFNYEQEIPKNIDKLKEYVSGLTLSFQHMYQLAFNIPEDTSPDQFPEGWGQSIGKALTCLKNNQ